MKKLILIIFLVSADWLWAKDAMVNAVFPQIVEQGNKAELYIIGEHIKDPQEILFYEDGFKCTKIEKSEFLPVNSKEEVFKLSIEVSKDAQKGEHFFRVKSKEHLSEMLSIWVTDMPIIDEEDGLKFTRFDRKNLKKPQPSRNNNNQANAQPITLNSTVSGYLPTNAYQDHDWYKVKMTKGQRLSVELLAARLGSWHVSGMNDLAVKVYDPYAKKVASNDDNSLNRQDPYVSIIAEHSGDYLVHIYQQMDYETGLRHYAAHIGTFARPAVTFPLGGQAGKEVEFEFIGDASGTYKRKIQLKADPGKYEEQYQFLSEGHTPTPNKIHVATYRDVFEENKLKTEDDPQIIKGELPLAINGRITTEGEVDWYSFQAKKGQKFRIRTYAKTCNSELDPKVILIPAKGNPARKSYEKNSQKSMKNWEYDDSLWPEHNWHGHHYRWQVPDRLDSIFMFEAKNDGEYLIGICDTRRQYSDRHIYRIEFQPHVDSAFVFLRDYRGQTPHIARNQIIVYPGKSYMRPMNVLNGFGSSYNGKLQLKALNLPDGLTLECRPFTIRDKTIPVMFHASSDAKPASAAVELVIEPVNKEERANFIGGFIMNNPATNRRGDASMYFKKTRKLAVAVCQNPTIEISVEQPAISLIQKGELTLKVKVKRINGFKGQIYCESEWEPEGVGKVPPMVIPADKNEFLYKISAAQAAKPGVYPLTITAREYKGGNARSGAGFHYVNSKFINLQVSEPFVEVKFARANIERGKTGILQASLQHIKKLPGDSVAKLINLPFGVEQLKPYPTVNASSKDVKFKVKVTGDCLLDQYKDISCEIIIEQNNQTIHQKTGNGLLRVDPERK